MGKKNILSSLGSIKGPSEILGNEFKVMPSEAWRTFPSYTQLFEKCEMRAENISK